MAEAALGARDGVSRRARALPPHAIREVMELAWARPGTIHLEVGEPDFPTPPHIVDAAHRAAQDGFTRYTSNAGLPRLREALAAKLARVNGYEVEPSQVVVAAGGVEAINIALTALTDPGDEVLIPDPAWPGYVQMASLLGLDGRRYHQTAATDHLPSIAELEQLIGERTRVLILNSPSNPLGAVIPPARLAELVELCERRDLWLISDECYDEIAFDGPATSTMAVAPSPRVVSVHSFSKVYAMTGWRVGYAAAAPAIAAALARLQEPLISSVNAPAQMAALEAIEGPQDVVAEMRDAYRDRRDLAVGRLAEVGLTALRPAGAFYIWVDVSAAGVPCADFARDLVESHGVAVAPGTAFGPSGEGFVRVCLAADPAALITGIDRLAERILSGGS
jgi:aspartate/methionine/tyrosine aminotransferase